MFLTNKRLRADYPEAVYPFYQLAGELRRAQGQRYYGVKTHIGWFNDMIVFAKFPSAPFSGAVIMPSGITGAICGANLTTPDVVVLLWYIYARGGVRHCPSDSLQTLWTPGQNI